jgi:phenylalanyl-tRNA synthetase beta chain
MKISINWIKQFVDIEASTDELIQKVGEQLGAVEEVIDLSEKYQDTYIVKVVKAEPHPNADKLTLCLIDDGKVVKDVARNDDGLVQVVCGAPNVEQDMLAVWIPPGATVPSSRGNEPFVLEARDIRGEQSNGMLASAKELAIGDDHSGIVEVDIPAEPGSSFVETYELDDVVLDIENKMFTHRPDCFGILGVAREIAGIFGKTFTSPGWYQRETPIDTPKKPDVELRVDNQIPDAVPRFMATTIDGLTIKESPLIIQTYLARVGIRPINNIVDATNYVMVLTGQPLHAYDAEKLEQLTGKRGLSLEARWSKKGDTLTLLDGKKVSFEDDATILITSHDIPVGVGGIMGGLDTEVDASTTRVVLECANFDMYTIRRASMQHGLFTDAVTRFNKGQSPHQNDRVLKEAVATLEFVAGGKVVSAVQDEGKKLPTPQPVTVTADFINQRLGTSVSSDQVKDVLTRVEFSVHPTTDALEVTPPFWRTDIEIAEDIVEEVGRLIGFSELPLDLPKRTLAPAQRNELLELKSTLRDVLSSAGANEVLTYSFLHGGIMQKYGQAADKAYRITNALSPDLQYYRLSLTPGLLEKVHPNIKSGHGEFVLFELGKAHVKGSQDTEESDLPREHERLAMIYAADEKTWQNTRNGAAYYQLTKQLQVLMRRQGVDYSIENLDSSSIEKDVVRHQLMAPYEPNRSGVIMVNGEPVGVIGELSAASRRAGKLPVTTAALELDITVFLQDAQVGHYQPLSKYPKSSQDISLKLSAGKQYSDVAHVIDKVLSKQAVQASYEPLDIYQPKDDASTKHIAFRVTAFSYEKTLKTEELSKILDEVAAAAEKELDATRL